MGTARVVLSSWELLRKTCSIFSGKPELSVGGLAPPPVPHGMATEDKASAAFLNSSFSGAVARRVARGTTSPAVARLLVDGRRN